jgi:putative glutathione S-transferase
MVYFRDGVKHAGYPSATHDAAGNFKRSEVKFRSHLESAADAQFPAVGGGRYHLYVSLACPWAHRCLIMLGLKTRVGDIGVSVVHPHNDSENDGWKFEADEVLGSTEDHVFQSKFVSELYLRADPKYYSWKSFMD